MQKKTNCWTTKRKHSRLRKTSLRIGITGGIACGKSSVSTVLAEKGVLVIDTDELTHRLLAAPNPTYEAVLARFGTHLVNEPGGPIDRKQLGQIVFSNADDKRDLETIMHPAIDAMMLQEMNQAMPGQVVAVQIPLLFECNLQEKGYFNEIWAIVVDPEIQLERLMKRNNLTQEEALKRINAQMSQAEKARLANRIIDNSDSLQHTRAIVMRRLRAAKHKFQQEKDIMEKGDTYVANCEKRFVEILCRLRQGLNQLTADTPGESVIANGQLFIGLLGPASGYLLVDGHESAKNTTAQGNPITTGEELTELLSELCKQLLAESSQPIRDFEIRLEAGKSAATGGVLAHINTSRHFEVHKDGSLQKRSWESNSISIGSTTKPYVEGIY